MEHIFTSIIFGQNSRFWPNIAILSKIEILVENRKFGHNDKFFGQQSKFWSNIKHKNLFPKICKILQQELYAPISNT